MRFLAVVVMGLCLTACDVNKDNDVSAQEAGAAVDRAVDDAGQQVGEVGQSLDRAGEKAEAAAREAGQDAKDVGREATREVRKGIDKVDRAADAAGDELKKDN